MSTQTNDYTPGPVARGLQAGDEEGKPVIHVVDQHLVAVPRPTVRDLAKALQDGEKLDAVPAWLRDWEGCKRGVQRNLRLLRHLCAAYTLQVPRIVTLLTFWTLLGVLKTVARLTFWLADIDGNPRMMEEKNRPSNTKEHLFTRKDHRNEVHLRWKLFAFGAVAVVIGVVALWIVLSAAALPVIGIPVLIYLVRAGKPSDKQIVSAAVRKNTTPRLTSQVIARALASIGVPELRQLHDKGRSHELFMVGGKPIVPIKTGWLATIDLPHGVTASQILERRDRLASGLRRPLGAVWPDGDPDHHEGRLRLYVLDKPLSKLPQPVWPLATKGRADIFGPIPYGYDTRGELVCIRLMYSNLLVGAIPRQGKTFAVKVIVLAAGLDPSVEMHIVELKGTGDLEFSQSFAHRYVSGPARPEDLEATMSSIKEVYSYLETRALTITKLGREKCPENKVTRELANDRSLRLWPVLLVIDEVQELFDSEYAAEAEQLLKAIIKRGPALGIMLVLSTQKPDKKSLPTGISSNMGLRLCLRVADQVANDMILGTSSYRMGMNACLFMDDDKGVGLLRDGGRTARIVRSAYIDGQAAGQIARRALALRTGLNTLSGDAVGQHAETEADRLSTVTDCLTVWPRVQNADSESAWLHELEIELSEEMPNRYGGLEQPWLGARLRALKIKTQDQRLRRVNGEAINRVGVTKRALMGAIGGTSEG